MANEFIGRRVEVGLARESSARGTFATPTYWVPKVDFSVADKVIKAINKSSYGNIGAEGNQALVAQKHAEGAMSLPLFDQSFGLFLYALLGTLSTSGPTDSLYTHTFSLQNDNSHDSLSISVIEADVSELAFRLAMIESLEMTIVPDDAVMLNVNFMSKRAADWNHGSPSYVAENKFLGRHLTFKLATDTSGLAAASNIPLRSITLRFIKNLRMDRVLGTVDLADILNQGFAIEGDIELNLTDTTYKALMLDGSYRAVRIDLTNGEALIGASSHPSFTLDLSRVHFESWEPARPNDEIASQSLTFKALYDISNGNIINSCTLKNSHDGSNY